MTIPELSTSDTGATSAPGRPAPSPLVDWRFLLPDAALGHVGVDARATPPVRAALATVAESVQELEAADGATYDTIVLSDPSRGDLDRALAALRPDGTVRVESAPRRRRAPLARALRSAGFDVSTWWARPNAGRPWCLVSLDRPVAAATVLRTVAGRGRRAGLEARFARVGLARRAGRDVALLATRRPADGTRPHAVAAPGPDTRVAGLVTPGFAASRAVIGVATDASGHALARIAKLARNPLGDAYVAAEAAALDEFHERSAGDAGRTPGNHHVAHHSGRLVLVEDAAPGRPLDRALVREHLHAALTAGVHWLDRVPVLPATALADDGRGEALLTAPLREVAALGTRHADARQDHVRRAGALLDELRLATLPVTFEHGDFSHPNLFVAEDDEAHGDLVAIDWERARPDGLPLQDLTFFIAYLAESLDRPHSATELVASYRRALRAGGWARADIDLHADRFGVDRRLVPLLEVACWTRALARLAETAPRDGSVDHRSDGHRHELLWIAAIEDAEERRR